MLRVKRLGPPVGVIHAGTHAAVATAAEPPPGHHRGGSFSNSWGTASCGLGGSPATLTPAATARIPSSASSPSRNEYAGSSAALRRITPRLRVDSTPVIECGYMNRASADPSAKEA